MDAFVEYLAWGMGIMVVGTVAAPLFNAIESAISGTNNGA